MSTTIPIPMRSISILYASETGTTEDYAVELARTLERLRFDVRVQELNDITLKQLSCTSQAIFMTSTTGQGDMPVNMQIFWKSLLRKKLPPNLLSGVSFTSFGLGDSTYPKYNWAVKKLHKRLLQLGAEEFYPRGEGDERHDEGIDGTLMPWTTDLCRQLQEKFPLPSDIYPIPAHQALPSKHILTQDTEATPPKDKYYQDLMIHRESSYDAILQKNDRLTPKTHFQDTRLLNFSLDRPTNHAPGDALSILPQNTPEVVDEFISIYSTDFDPDAPLTCTPNPNASNTSAKLTSFVNPLTLRTLLTYHLDITAIPRRSFFSFIAAFTDDETHRERLLEFTDPQYLDELYDYTTRPRRSILEVLQEFSTVKIPLSYLLEVIPRIRPRLFSIASSSNQYPMNQPQVDLLVAIVKYRTVIKKIRQGLCTRYLSSLPVGTKISVTISKGGLSPKHGEDQSPVVMIGPGTGVAPMRALTWQRILNKDAQTPQKGDNLLFFGCRGKEVDYYFRNEWEHLSEDNDTAFQVVTAFSRHQESKEYVQHQIKRHAERVYHLLHDLLGVVYVCGSSGRMPQAVREALIEVFEAQGKLDRNQAEKYLLNMENEGRYRQETW